MQTASIQPISEEVRRQCRRHTAGVRRAVTVQSQCQANFVVVQAGQTDSGLLDDELGS